MITKKKNRKNIICYTQNLKKYILQIFYILQFVRNMDFKNKKSSTFTQNLNNNENNFTGHAQGYYKKLGNFLYAGTIIFETYKIYFRKKCGRDA